MDARDGEAPDDAAVDRARADALRARIAVLAAGPVEPPPPSSADLAIRVETAVGAAMARAFEVQLPLVLQRVLGERLAILFDHDLEPRLTAVEDAIAAVSERLDAIAGGARESRSGHESDESDDFADSDRSAELAESVATAVATMTGRLDESDELTESIAAAVATMTGRLEEFVREARAVDAANVADTAVSTASTASIMTAVDALRYEVAAVAAASAGPETETEQVSPEDLVALRDELAVRCTALVALAQDVRQDTAHHAGLLEATQRQAAVSAAAQNADLLSAFAGQQAEFERASDEYRHAFEASADEHRHAFEATAAGQRATFEACAAAQRSALDQSAVTSRQAVLDATESGLSALRAAAEVQLEALAGARTTLLDAAQIQVTAVENLPTQTRAAVAGAVADVEARLATAAGQALDDARAAAVLAATDTVRTAVADGAERLTDVAAETADDVALHREELALMSDRIRKAGTALVSYLADRDVHLERVRDRLAEQVLLDFAAGLGEHERRAGAKSAAALLGRRRDARDAERWREGLPANAVVPPEFADEDALVAVLDATQLRRREDQLGLRPPAARPKSVPEAVSDAAVSESDAKPAPRRRPASKKAPPSAAVPQHGATQVADPVPTVDPMPVGAPVSPGVRDLDPVDPTPESAAAPVLAPAPEPAYPSTAPGADAPERSRPRPTPDAGARRRAGQNDQTPRETL